MSGAVWLADAGSFPGRDLRRVVPLRPQFTREQAPRSAALDDYLGNEDAPRTIKPPPAPRDRHGHLNLGCCPPWVANPPQGRVTRNGASAQLATGPRREPASADVLHAQLPADAFDPEPGLEPMPADGMVGIAEVAKILHLSVNRVRALIKEGIIPEAPARGPGRRFAGPLGMDTSTAKRLWPAAAITRMQVIAREEGQLSKPRRHLSDTNFSSRMHRLAESWGHSGDQA